MQSCLKTNKTGLHFLIYFIDFLRKTLDKTQIMCYNISGKFYLFVDIFFVRWCL